MTRRASAANSAIIAGQLVELPKVTAKMANTDKLASQSGLRQVTILSVRTAPGLEGEGRSVILNHPVVEVTICVQMKG